MRLPRRSAFWCGPCDRHPARGGYGKDPDLWAQYAFDLWHRRITFQGSLEECIPTVDPPRVPGPGHGELRSASADGEGVAPTAWGGSGYPGAPETDAGTGRTEGERADLGENALRGRGPCERRALPGAAVLAEEAGGGTACALLRGFQRRLASGHGSPCPCGLGGLRRGCLLYTSDAADDLLCVDLGGRRII